MMNILRRFRNNQYAYFFIKLGAFLLMLYLCDLVAGSLLSNLYFSQESGVLYRSTFAIEQTEADLMVFGSSKAVHHYNSRIFEDRLNTTTYNAGSEGHDILYHYAVLKCNLERGHVPKMAILDIHEGELISRESSYDRLSVLLPYYQRHPEIRDIIELRSRFEKYKLLSKIYPYNSILFSIIVGNLEINKARNPDINGYIPLSGVWTDTLRDATGNGEIEIDSTKLAAFESFLRDCKTHAIELYIVSSPYYERRGYLKYLSDMQKEIALRYNVPFYDFSESEIFLTDRQLFSDVEHMNGDGADVFSNMLIDRILEDKSGLTNPAQSVTVGAGR